MSEENDKNADLQKSITGLRQQVKELSEAAAAHASKGAEEVKKLGTIAHDTSGKLADAMAASKEASERLSALEQKLTQANAFAQAQADSSGDLFIKSDAYKGSKSGVVGEVAVGNLLSRKTAIVNATPNTSQPLVAPDARPGIVMPGLQTLRIRDLLPVVQTNSNIVVFARETGFTNNAGPQYSGSARENVAKNESALTFEQANAIVETLAHGIPVSRQIVADAPMLAGYINTRLRYGLAIEEEDELLNGDGSSGKLDGLINQADSFSGAVTGDQQMDILLRALTQVALSNYSATGIVVHPTDWMNIQLLKDDLGRYIIGNPQGGLSPTLWGVPVVSTASIDSGDFLVGSFALGAQIAERESTTVRIADQHADLFVKNMLYMLAEQREALVVFRPSAFVTGSFA